MRMSMSSMGDRCKSNRKASKGSTTKKFRTRPLPRPCQCGNRYSSHQTSTYMTHLLIQSQLQADRPFIEVPDFQVSNLVLCNTCKLVVDKGFLLLGCLEPCFAALELQRAGKQKSMSRNCQSNQIKYLIFLIS